MQLNEPKPTIQLEDLDKLDIRVGTITAAEKLTKSDKLIKLTVDFGPLGVRTILTAIGKFYLAEDFIGMQTLFIVNLAPRKMMGLESQGMIMAVDVEDASTVNPSDAAFEGTAEQKPIFILPKEKTGNGFRVI